MVHLNSFKDTLLELNEVNLNLLNSPGEGSVAADALSGARVFFFGALKEADLLICPGSVLQGKPVIPTELSASKK